VEAARDCRRARGPHRAGSAGAGVQRLEVTANPHAMGFYRAAGFLDCGAADTIFGAAPRMALAIH